MVEFENSVTNALKFWVGIDGKYLLAEYTSKIEFPIFEWHITLINGSIYLVLQNSRKDRR